MSNISQGQQFTSSEEQNLINLKQKYLIAASTAPAGTIALADYVCDGVADDVQINAAIAAIVANGNGGGVVELSEGNFNLAASITLAHSYITVQGRGIGATLVKTQAGTNVNPFTFSGTGTIHLCVKRMQIDCNSANNTFGSGVHINTPWQTYDAEHILEDLLITNCNNNGVEVAVNADTRAMFFNRVHVKGVSGNGFYFPWPSITDTIFTDCIADTVALNGFYQGGANNHHTNCKMFYCGSAGGANFGFNLVGYNNYFDQCEAQDCYQGGFYGDVSGGDPTYKNFGCTFVNCIADSNNQNSNASYGCGLQGIGVKYWTVIGGVYFSRPYYSFQQRIGISLQSGADQNYVKGAFFYANSSIGYSDTSTGSNYYTPGAGSNPWEEIGGLDVRMFGAKGDAKLLFGVVATNNSTSVSCAGAAFTQADVGKQVLVYKEQFYGVITTIASVQSATAITLTANSGVTSSSSTGYMIYGTDDSTIIQKVLTLAATFVAKGSTSDVNQSMGSGRIKVILPGNANESLYLVAAQLVIPFGVTLEAEGKVANFLPNRNTPIILSQQFTGIDKLELENLGGTGLFLGSSGNNVQTVLGDIRIWHGIGAQSAGADIAATSLAGTPSTSGGHLADNTYYYVVTWIDSTGGESVISNEATATVSGGGGSGSVALSWTAPAGVTPASYRIYRGTAAGLENIYYTSGTNSYSDTTGGAGTSAFPTPPGYGIKFSGDDWKAKSIFIKECRVGLYLLSADDILVDTAFIIGSGTPLRIEHCNQVYFGEVMFDTCGPSSIYASLGGLTIDNGCSNVTINNLNEATINGVSRNLTPVVNIGSLGGTANDYIRIKYQANNSGGTGLSIANAQDVDIEQLLSNVVYSSGVTNAIVTAVVYGTGLTNEIRIKGTYSSGITVSSGTQVGTHAYELAGTLYGSKMISVNSVSGNTNAGSSPIDYVYFVSATATITLPTAVGNTNVYTIKNTGTGTVTVNTTSSQTIDGSLTITLPSQYQSVDIISNNSNWFIT